jgi:hypothetical protein
LWFRLGITPDTPFGSIHQNPLLAGLIPDVFANSLIGEDPQVPVYRASPADNDGVPGPDIDQARFRVLMPGGHARGTTWTLHGHQWQRQPYVCGAAACNFINGSSQIGDNPLSEYFGAQEGINPTGHWDFVVNLGGHFNVTGDYLLRDQASFGSYQGPGTMGHPQVRQHSSGGSRRECHGAQVRAGDYSDARGRSGRGRHECLRRGGAGKWNCGR